MFSLPRVPVPSFFRFGGGNYPKVDLPSVEIHDIETDAEKRPRTLKHLLKANHANYSIIYNNLRYHNHAPHILGSAYILGGTAEHLNEIYEKQAEDLEPWKDSPGEISKDDWRDFLGKGEYQRAFIDFFEDQLVNTRYDLKALLDDYMFSGKEPLINCMISGLAHPLIHLGYAYELQSTTIAVEALALGACFYGPIHKYLDNPKYTKPSLYRGADDQPATLIQLLDRVRKDKRFEGLYEHGSGSISKVMEEREAELLEYWNAFEIVEPNEQFEQSQRIAVSLLMETPLPSVGKLNFFFVHILTSSHAIRVLLPLVPAKFHVNLLRQWWIFTLAVYIAQMRPEIKEGSLNEVGQDDRTWKHVVHEALDGKHAKDAHYVKALRSMQVCGATYGDDNDFFLKAALKFIDDFDDWGAADQEKNTADVAHAEQ